MQIKKLIVIAFFMLTGLFTSVQAQDLIVTAQGDSLNSKITKVEPEYLYFSINKDGGVLNTLLPMAQVSYYKYNFYSTPALPVDAKVDGPKDFPRLRLAINGGWSYRLAKVAGNLSSTQQDYIKGLKSGYSYGAELAYYWSKKAGIGAKYDVFRSRNELEDVSGQVVVLSDDVAISFIGPYYSSRFLTANKKNSFLMNVGLGYVGYNDKAFFGSDYELTGGTAGLLVDLGYDIGLSKSFALGFQLSFIGGTLTQYMIDDGFNTTTIELDEDEYEGLARINLSVGLRLIK
ncbi:MAG: hypothetical protein IPL92_14905 [Saprospiraceae bacterium]|nr:hypothetical protein [Candidatus Opimibacter iunctus]